MQFPVLTTDRLTLRTPRRDDFEVYAPALMSDHARFIGGPFDLCGAWHDFASDAGVWVLCGYGPFMIEISETGQVAGMVALHHPPHFPERELGWILLPDCVGQGLAFEAAQAARAHAFQTLGWSTVVSYIHPANTRSIALAERLGAVRDDAALRPDPDDLVYRHLAPEALQ